MACSDNDTNPADIVIAEGQQDLTVSAGDTEKTIQFTAAGAWRTEINYLESEAAAVEPWITLDPSSGEAGEVTIKIGFTANIEKAERKAQIKIICEETVVTVTVGQKGETSEGEHPGPAAKKMVSSVEIRSIDHSVGSVQEDQLLYSFKYDELDRLTEQCLTNKIGESYIHKLAYTTDGIQVMETLDNETETWRVTLNEKGAAAKLEVSGTYGGYNDQTYSFSYDGAGHLTGETWKRDDTEYCIDYSWKNGNLASVVYKYGSDENPVRDTLANGYIYRNSPVNNQLNIDPNLFVATLEARDGSANSNRYYPRKGRMDLLALWGLLGKRSEGYIAQSMDEYASGHNPEDEFYYDYQRTYYPFSYELDEEGNLLSITDKTDVKIYKVITSTGERTLMEEVTDQVVYTFTYKN